ncbi:MAG TPA: translation initiation factor IF-2, partial [Anaerolineaceae bacterium]|nr:translation initiation factor IF-2 [Anaerolineaceae bacterium]
TDVAGGEAGGITQHIGAYQVEHKGQLITFLDTPGHAAFTAMRSRGAQGADIVILVVAADDGVMPQTKEAIAHAKAARVPIIVALNKIDRPDANPDFAKRQLSENGLVPDDWDGDTMIVPVSAKERTGIDDLLEAILLTTEGMSIKANPNGKKVGTVIEAEIDKTKGVMATLLVQNGTVNSADIIVAGSSYGRIRAMFDYKNKPIRKAGPSTPMLIMGMNDVPQAGDIFQVVGSTKEALSIVTDRKQAEKDSKYASPKATLEELFSRVQAGEEKELRLIIKADVQGSIEPIMNSLNDLGSKEININILHAETGNISENDVMLASASKAIIVGFNVTADASAKRMAEVEGVSIRLYKIIYRLIEDVEKALKGMLEPEYVDVIIGKAEVLAIFKIQKIGAIAGCKISTGEFRRNAKARVVRNEEVIHEGEISSLKHEKDDVREVRTGFECGIGLKGFNEFEVGDTILCFTKELSTA